MDNFLQELANEFPEGGTPVKPSNTYADSLALYNKSQELNTEALRMGAGVDPVYQQASPEAKRGIFQGALQDAMDFFKQYPTYKPVSNKSVRAGDRAMNIPIYAKPKGEPTDFLSELKSQFPSE